MKWILYLNYKKYWNTIKHQLACFLVFEWFHENALILQITAILEIKLNLQKALILKTFSFLQMPLIFANDTGKQTVIDSFCNYWISKISAICKITIFCQTQIYFKLSPRVYTVKSSYDSVSAHKGEIMMQVLHSDFKVY